MYLKIKWLVDRLRKMSLARVFCDFMKYHVIYRSGLLAMKGGDKTTKGEERKLNSAPPEKILTTLGKNHPELYE